MTSILTNDEAEQLLLDIRVGRAAARADVGDTGGAFVAFPTSVVVAVAGRGQNVFPLRTESEPGSLCRGAGRSAVSGQVDGVTVEGCFWWAVDRSEARTPSLPLASYRFHRGGHCVPAPAWSHQLPRSQSLPPLAPSSLARTRRRLARRGAGAEHELLTRTAKVFESCCRGPLRRAIAVRPAIDVADVVQRAMQVAGRLLPVYASPGRPPCSWLGMIQLDGRRDLHRAVTQLDWLPRDLGEVIARLETAGLAPDLDPTVTLAAIIEAAVEHHQPIPRATPRQIEAALAAPQILPLHPSPNGAASGPRALSFADPALDAVDERHGHLATIAARLVRAEPQLAALASLGDDQAIDRVGQRIIAALGHPGETRASTRQRCRRELGRGGRLFSSPEGLGRFGHHAPPTHLAELDAALAAVARRVP